MRKRIESSMVNHPTQFVIHIRMPLTLNESSWIQKWIVYLIIDDPPYFKKYARWKNNIDWSICGKF